MRRRSLGHAPRLVVRAVTASAIIAALLSVVASASLAGGPKGTNVPCKGPKGGASALIAAINDANSDRRRHDQARRSPVRTQLTAADNGSNGGNGLPVITTPITLTGDHDATIAGRNESEGRTSGSSRLTVPEGNLAPSTSLTITGGVSNLCPAAGSSTCAGTLSLDRERGDGERPLSRVRQRRDRQRHDRARPPAARRRSTTAEVSGNTAAEQGGGGILNRAGALTAQQEHERAEHRPGGRRHRQRPGQPPLPRHGREHDRPQQEPGERQHGHRRHRW